MPRVNPSRAHAAGSVAKGQQGAALVVILLLLLIVTLLGLAGVRGALLQERMAAAAMTRANAFQVGEAVLREAEAFAMTKPSVPSAGCLNGICAEAKGTTPVWQASGFWEGNNGWTLAKADLGGNDGSGAIRARYVIEPFGEAESTSCTMSEDMSAVPCSPTAEVYRVTVMSRAADGAEVLLQTLFQVP